MGKTHLKRLRVDRVDLVDEGAQPDAHIALFKRRDGDDGAPAPRHVEVSKITDPASLDAHLALIRQGFSETFKGEAPDGGWWYVDAVYDDHVIACAEKSMSLYRVAYTVEGDGDGRRVALGQPELVTITYQTKADLADDTKESPMTIAETLAAITDDTLRKSIEDAFAAETAARETAEAALVTAEAALEAAKAKGPEDEDGDEGGEDAAMKALPEDVRKRVEAAETAAAEARAEVAKVRDEQALDAAVAKARVDYAAIGEAGEVGGLIHRLSKHAAAEDIAALDRILKGAAAKIDTGTLFAEAGVGGAPSDALASEIAKVKAANPTMSDAEATAAALNANPNLFA